MTTIRWILVLPAAVLGATVAQIVTILVTAFLPDAISQLVGSATIPIGFVLLGARVAPTRRVHVAGVLCILMILFQGMYLGGVLFGLVRDYSPLVKWLSLPIGVAASIVGLYVVYNQERGSPFRGS